MTIYDKYQKVYDMTPTREEAAIKLARKSYPSVKEEVKVICSDKTNSKLKSDDVTNFSWDSIWSELLMYMPRLAIFLKEILPDSSNDNRRVICLIISMILKYRYPKMSLVQKVISMYVFGNSVHKKVCFSTFNFLTYKIVNLILRFTIAYSH